MNLALRHSSTDRPGRGRRRLIDRKEAVRLFNLGHHAGEIGQIMGYPRESIVRVLIEELGSSARLKRAPRNAISPFDRKDAQRIIALIRARPMISMAELMGETGWLQRRVHNAVTTARRRFKLPVAMIRFGAHSFETYYQILPRWPEAERIAA
ncbi:MAG TPA: hypothetical protein VGN97_12310 [Mesorhizobium sp.]|jgi:hypothetical protein|nr:hypothetical protein [Mesorhizobium sp.]